MPKWVSKLDALFRVDLMGYEYIEPTTDQPVLEDLEEILWINKDFPCIDGCWVSDVWGYCDHQRPTWYRYLEFDPNPYGITISELCV